MKVYVLFMVWNAPNGAIIRSLEEVHSSKENAEKEANRRKRNNRSISFEVYEYEVL